MKLPRYPVARSVTGELQAARNVQISPAEAANAAMAKWGAVASVAGSVSDVALAVNEIKGEEEALNAVTSWSNAITEEHEALRETVAIDEDGRFIYNDQKILEDERSINQTVTNNIRDSLSSATAKRKFDRWISENGVQAREKFHQTVLEKSTEVIKANVDTEIKNSIDKKQFDVAEDRALAAVHTNAYGIDEYNAAIIDIGTQRTAHNKAGDENYVYSELNDLQTTPEDLNEVLVSLGNGTRGDGTPLTISEQEQNVLMGKLRTKMNTFEEDNDDANKKVEREAFFELYKKGLNRELTLDIYEQTANKIGGFNSGYDKILRDMATGTTTDNYSSADDLRFFRESVRGLKLRTLGEGDNWKEEADNLLVDIALSDLSQTHREQFSKLVTDEVGSLDDDRYKLWGRQVYVDIVGYEEGMIGSLNINGDYDDKISMGVKARIALLDELERTGTSDGLDDWWQGTPGQPGMKATFRAELNAETIQKVMTKPVKFPVDGKIDEEWRTEVTASMLEWYETASQDSTSAERESDLNDAIAEFEKLTGIKITDPVIKPIEVKK